MNKKDIFLKYGLEFIVIVIGILISFNIQRSADVKREKNEIKDSIATLSHEIQSNINYCKEHLIQLQNMKVVNDSILLNFKSLKKLDLINWHNKYPFGHSYLEDGKLRYWTNDLDYENLYLWMITWWNTFAQNEIYFQSLISSGLLLNIEDKSIREDIESVYVTKKKRVETNESLLKEISQKIFLWVEEKRDNSKVTISREFIFKNKKDLKLKNLLEDRSFRIELRIMSIKNYISSLNSLKLKLENEF
tara:strand:+ start:1436 stop:2179 length:744 start_codon:yes stop_codon:yes gene_type:complete